MTTVTFRNQDKEYGAWLQQHKHDGFVMNNVHLAKSKYIKLHRATCSYINRAKDHGKRTIPPYIKIVGTDRQKLCEKAREMDIPEPTLCKCV